MTLVKPALTFSCPERWDKMKVGLVSRYCDNCKRDVQDFTRMTKEEILQFLLSNRNKKVCGRIYKSQLDYHHNDILITIHSYLQKHENSNLSFYLLAVGTLMLLGCSRLDLKPNAPNTSTIHATDSQPGNRVEPRDTSDIDSLFTEIELMGDLVVGDSLPERTDAPWNVYGENGVRILAEVMPEFEGGFANLYTYIQKHLSYPSWEQQNGIEGNVYVTFIVGEDGKLRDPRILKSVEGSRNFDEEVLRLISTMPDWKPGQQDGQNVAVQFTIPIRFKR